MLTNKLFKNFWEGFGVLAKEKRERVMDYSLAALKLLCSQLKHAREVASQNGFTLGGILFQRPWLQVSTFPSLSLSTLLSYSQNATVFNSLCHRAFWSLTPTTVALCFSTTEPASSSFPSPRGSTSAVGKLVKLLSLYLNPFSTVPHQSSLYLKLWCLHFMSFNSMWGFLKIATFCLQLLNCLCNLYFVFLKICFCFCFFFAGMYVMVVGGYVVRTGEPPMIKVMYNSL